MMMTKLFYLFVILTFLSVSVGEATAETDARQLAMRETQGLTFTQNGAYCGLPLLGYPWIPRPQPCGMAFEEDRCLMEREFIQGDCVWENGRCMIEQGVDGTSCDTIEDETTCMDAFFAGFVDCEWYDEQPAVSPVVFDSPATFAILPEPAAVILEDPRPPLSVFPQFLRPYCGLPTYSRLGSLPCGSAVQEAQCRYDQEFVEGYCTWDFDSCFFEGVLGTGCDIITVESTCSGTYFAGFIDCEWFKYEGYFLPPYPYFVSPAASTSSEYPAFIPLDYSPSLPLLLPEPSLTLASESHAPSAKPSYNSVKGQVQPPRDTDTEKTVSGPLIHRWIIIVLVTLIILCCCCCEILQFPLSRDS